MLGLLRETAVLRATPAPAPETAVRRGLARKSAQQGCPFAALHLLALRGRGLAGTGPRALFNIMGLNPAAHRLARGNLWNPLDLTYGLMQFKWVLKLDSAHDVAMCLCG